MLPYSPYFRGKIDWRTPVASNIFHYATLSIKWSPISFPIALNLSSLILIQPRNMLCRRETKFGWYYDFPWNHALFKKFQNMGMLLKLDLSKVFEKLIWNYLLKSFTLLVLNMNGSNGSKLSFLSLSYLFFWMDLPLILSLIFREFVKEILFPLFSSYYSWKDWEELSKQRSKTKI